MSTCEPKDEGSRESVVASVEVELVRRRHDEGSKEWYEEESLRRSEGTGDTLPGHCPFRALKKCPQYFESRALLGQVASKSKEKLKAYWERTDLYPLDADREPSITHSTPSRPCYSAFCPETLGTCHGVYASALCSFADDIDREAKQKRLKEEGVPASSWHYWWEYGKPAHYADCPSYLLLRPGQTDAPSPATEGSTAPSDNRNNTSEAERQDAARGRKVLESARAGHEMVHGTQEQKEARWADYQKDYDELHTRNPNLSHTAVCKKVADKHGCCSKTVSNRVTSFT